jgi:hypothetical protein
MDSCHTDSYFHVFSFELLFANNLVTGHCIGLKVAVEESLYKPRIKQLHLCNTPQSICSGLTPTSHTFTGVTVDGHQCNVCKFIYEINNYFYTRSLFFTASEVALQTAN